MHKDRCREYRKYEQSRIKTDQHKFGGNWFRQEACNFDSEQALWLSAESKSQGFPTLSAQVLLHQSFLFYPKK